MMDKTEFIFLFPSGEPGYVYIRRDTAGKRWLSISHTDLKDSSESNIHIPIDNNWTEQECLLAILLSSALRITERVTFELGDSVVIIGDSVYAVVLKIVFKLCGCVPVIHVNNKISELKMLNDIVKTARRLTVIDTTGDTVTIESTLNNLRFRDRLILIGGNNSIITVNTYRDIHKKGVEVYGFSPAWMFDFYECGHDKQILEKAINLIRLRDLSDLTANL